MIQVNHLDKIVKRVISKLAMLALAVVAPMSLALISSASATDPQPWQIGFPEPASPVAKMMADFHNLWLTPVIIFIAVFVLLLMIYTCWRFSEKRNPVPSKTTHNAMLEVVWTGIPVIILLVLLFPSLKLLYASDDLSGAEMTVKITGHQWYWEYEYPDHGGFYFDAYLEARTAEEAEEYGVKRLLDTDNAVVLPINTKIRLQFTSADVLHNWAVSRLGVRVDTVPGRLNEAPVEIDQVGRYYGFCSELCGVDHAYMPIMIDAVTPEEFEAWVAEAQEEFAVRGDVQPTAIATKN